MTNFEKVAASPETLGAFLSSLPIVNSPWEEAFHKMFCADCEREDCDAGLCPHQDVRTNPTWWLNQEGEPVMLRPGMKIKLCAKESPRAESDTQAISNGMVVMDNETEIATITMSITTLRGFRKKHIRELLKRFAETSHLFYLEAGNALKKEP